MITKPLYVGSSQQSVAPPSGDVGPQMNNCSSVFIYDDHADRQRTSGVDNNYYDCIADDSSRPTDLIYPPTQHSSQLQQLQQQSGADDDDAAMKLQLLDDCGSKISAIEYPWMRDKKCPSDAMCLSDRRLKQCLTSDSLAQTRGLSVVQCI